MTSRFRKPLLAVSFFLAACVMLFASSAHAEVVKMVVEKREAFAHQGRSYEKLTGHFYGELDARNPFNAIITDIEHAPRNARGRVEYSATFTILKPVDMTGATGVLVYEVPNRGRAGIAGGGYFADFRSQGHVLVASGWQADIAAGAGVETMVTPIAKNADGSSITGPVMSRFADMPVGSSTQTIIRGRVTGTATPASLDTRQATLTRRASENGSRVPLRADEWAFADCATVPFPGTAAPDKVCLKGGFDLGVEFLGDFGVGARDRQPDADFALECDLDTLHQAEGDDVAAVAGVADLAEGLLDGFLIERHQRD